MTTCRLALALVAALAIPRAAHALAPTEAFDKLKALSGTWSAEVKGMGAAATVAWKTTAGGSAVVETLFQGTDHEMMSVYFLDGGTLRMTHYCAAGNQPRMRYDAKRSTAEELVFVFDGGTSFNPKKDMHIHEGRILFTPAGVQERWVAWADGAQADVKEFTLREQL